nr:MAG TPA: hypothetical protein [Caudoviricetes sp.]
MGLTALIVPYFSYSINFIRHLCTLLSSVLGAATPVSTL